MAYKGRFKPQNTRKYKGDHTKITYRSSWEAHVMSYCDKHPDIIEWSSEEVVIRYISPIDGKPHRYFPDFLITKRNPDNTITTLLVEVKPKHQTMPPDISKKNTPKGRVSRRYLNEVATWGVNSAKWEAAEMFCAKRGWKFVKWTEDQIFGKGKKK